MKIRTILIISLGLFLFSTCKVQGSTTEIRLTEAEKSFIENHTDIQLGIDPHFVPFEFIDTDGLYKGIAADYTQIINERTGLKMVVAHGLTWSEAYEKAVEREIDVLPSVSKTEGREQFFLFSEPYYTFQRVMIINDNNDSIQSLKDLENRQVAVQENSSHHSYMQEFSSINLSLYSEVERALEAVSNGDEIAFIGNLASTSYLIRENGVAHLKVIRMDDPGDQSIYFAIRKDWPELVSIINKVLVSITEEEKIEINNRWIGIESNVDYSKLIQVIITFIVLVLIVFIVSWYWITKLRKEVAIRKRTQEALVLAKVEAETANAVKSSFLARMSHEIRTPLHAITGMTYLMKRTNISVAQSLYLDRINHASKSMLSIIDDILDFSKIEAGKIEVEHISFNLDTLMQQVFHIVSFKIDEQGNDFIVDKQLHVPTNFLGDPKRLEQVLINLISNALKFTQSGQVSVVIRIVAVHGDIYHIEFNIKDTGIGMTEEQVNQLFVPFNQADTSISRRFGGTGLGLSIVKSLLDLMQGEIRVYSTLDVGSSFTIQLPLEIDREVLKSHDLIEKAIDHCEKVDFPYQILIVEDNKTNQFIAQSILEQAGYVVHATDNGKEGYEYYVTHKTEVDLILMDLHMPVLDGYEATLLIRKVNPSIPIIAMTADAITGVEEKCRAVGISSYVSKPFDPEHLIARISEQLSGQPLALVELPILDISYGIKVVGNNEDVYKSILRIYYKENEGILSKLQISINDKNYEEAIQIVHKVKGSSGNIGAKRLHETASELQHALTNKDEEGIHHLFFTFEEILGKLYDEIVTFVPSLEDNETD